MWKGFITMDKDRFFEELYVDYYKKIYSYLRCRVQNVMIAEDLTNDIFVLVYKNIQTYDDSKGLIATWIYTITNNHLKNYYRSLKKREYSYDSLEAIHEELLYDRNDYVGRKELNIVLEQMMEQLPVRSRTIIKMKYYGNMTSAEIGARLRISSENVRVILKRSLNKMKDMSHGEVA